MHPTRVIPMGALLALLLPALLGSNAGSVEIRCMPGLLAHANADGSITLSWPPLANITAWQVIVREDGGTWYPITPQVTAGADSYTYSASVAGHSYEFSVVALLGPSQQYGEFCHAFIDAIPFFPSAGAFALGTVGALGGVLLVFRRKP
ncbi:MAG: fibronectin type III domain-containing protein [Thermoplasmatota archaeon]